MKDFFISYNKSDLAWAEWIAWVLEDAGYRVFIEEWDFRPGENSILRMHHAAQNSKRTIAILSNDYLTAAYNQREWAIAFAKDDKGQERSLIPIMVRACSPAGLLGDINYVDLVDLSEQDARIAVLGAFSSRAKPAEAPAFPTRSKEKLTTGEEEKRAKPYPGAAGNKSRGNITDAIVSMAGDEPSELPVRRRGRELFELSARERVEMVETLSAIPSQQFNIIIFALDPPAGLIPPMPAPQMDRAFAFLEWAKSPAGCGVREVQQILSHVSKASGPRPAEGEATDPTTNKRVVLLCERKEQPDEHVLKLVESALSANGYRVFIDNDLDVGVEWAKTIERELSEAYAVIPLLSAASVSSEMFTYEIQITHDAGQHKGPPHLLPIRVNYNEPLQDPLAGILNPLRFMSWHGPHDDSSLTEELLASLQSPPTPSAVDPPKPASLMSDSTPLDPPWGAVPLNSNFYVTRHTDRLFSLAIVQNHGIVRVKGARQMGKTSLLARGLQKARSNGARVVVTDFQSINTNTLASMDLLFQVLGRMIADQLELSVFPKEVWDPDDGPNGNFRRYLAREVLNKISGPLIWGLDEVDALFTYDIGKEVFAFFRSLFNARELEPDGPWRRLTLAIVYATEAHLFINDPNMSPFNVGTPLELQDFDLAQIEVLNQRYGKPLTGGELHRFYDLLGGHPYLVRRGFYEMRTQPMSFADFQSQADRDEGPFGDHLRRILVLLARDSDMSDEMRNVLRGRNCSTKESFYRLRSAGVVSGDTERNVKPRCKVYQLYLSRYLL